MKKLLSTGLLFSLITCSFGQSSSEEVREMGLTFKPDYRFDGSTLTGWHSVGDVDWQAQSGELIGKVRPGATNGLVVMDRSYQDVGVHTLFKCSEDSEAGLVFRLEKTSAGMKGILVSIKNGGVASYAITFDADGHELQREELRPADGLDRLARPGKRAGDNDERHGNASNRGGHSPHADSGALLKRPDTSFRPGEWNQIEVFFDLNIIRPFLNDGGQTGVGATDEGDGEYGPVALYAGGAGEVRFKDFGCKDLAARSTPKEETSPRFRVQRISDMYYSWGCAAADFNKDGFMDIVAGPYIYFGPDFTSYREIYPAFPFNPAKDFAEVNCEYAFDFSGDGWPDVLTGPPNATLYVNPKGESRRWDKQVVVPGIQTEVTVFKDIDGSGIPALVYGKDGTVRYAKPDPADPAKPWIEHIISEKGYSLAHGIGVGDINGDGRMDILNPNGWWEQPATGADSNLWTFHPVAFGRYGHRGSNAGGAVMGVYDVNGDGLNDVVTSLNAHGFGLAWFEQKRDANGNISFIRHMISDDYSAKNAGDVTFSQPHGSTFADVDGDGIPDFIVGKRYWTHLDDYFDPNPEGDPVLYWYRTVRNPKAPGGAEFVPELIHNRSGAGSDILAVDLNKDGAIDIVTSTDRGTFIFWNTPTNTSRTTIGIPSSK